MKRSGRVSSILVVLFAAFATIGILYAQETRNDNAQKKTESSETQKRNQMGMMKEEMPMKKDDMGMMKKDMKSKMHQHMAGMEGMPMMRQCKMMMNTKVDKLSPDAILALDEDLQLTAEQKDELEQIAKSARERAKAVLTQEQQASLDEIEVESATMMEMHKTMMKKMKSDDPAMAPMKEKMHMMMSHMSARGESDMMCPMMAMMEEDQTHEKMKTETQIDEY